ncbi:GGDEF domain-containing protein [Butyrivibrio sp. CB08]|uniref:GGDEF domain-containing phosphodiesterase n=1 Tax=Butyrivibrio sp. CB08 TaxID=2364879 RepID=UPI000EA9E907|nr:GGDEF domain-containing phosphodiesterase [Butyrivibrio sp. CB08]RKM62281.1 GGDEF domain-containing protein [Butyrivibrio sp. CB08]
MTFDRSFENFVQILSEEEVTPEISPSALADLSKEFFVRSIFSIVTFRPGSDKASEPPKIIPLCGPVITEGKPSYVFKSNMSGDRVIMYHVYLQDDKRWNDEEYKFFSIIIDVLSFHMERFLLLNVVKTSAMTQYLTGLPNSGGFISFVTQKFESGEIMKYDSICFNLKSFGLISRRYGGPEGDEIMKRYANTIKNFAEDDEIISHFGGDNYTALIKKDRTKKFLKFISAVPVYGMKNDKKDEFNISAVAGVYAIDESMKNPGQAISRASMACNYAKNIANKPYVFVNKAMSTRIYRQKQIEDRFEEALSGDEFRIYLQPKVDTVTGKIVGAESLARWFCNGLVLYPTEFVPILEREGMVVHLDLYILKKTCEFIRSWMDKGIEPVQVSVNFSRKDLEYKNLAKEIMDIIDSYGIDRNLIEIEVTETASEGERVLMTSFLSNLKEASIATAIDDFGTGYSSLSTLRDFPVSVIKIDRSFINNEELNKSDEIVLKSIVAMANELGISVVSEGVERPDQTKLLQSVGCNVVQGFLYDNPMPMEDFEKRLEKGSYN